MKAIPKLRNRHYYPIPIPLDGDQPKEYIKAYFYFKNCPKAISPSKWKGYFAKFGGKSYPHESIIEYIINRIGLSMGINMNQVRLVIINGQVRFLSQDFLTPGQKLVHGVEILAEYFQDRGFVEEINKDRKTRREFFTFEEVNEAIKYVYPLGHDIIMLDLVKMIVFDAIVGNNDRHYHNWGVIDYVEKVEGKRVRLSPIYDTARALFWNKTDEAVKTMYKQNITGSDELKHFAHRTKPRFSFDDNHNADHFQLLSYLSSSNAVYRDVITKLLTQNVEYRAVETLRIEADHIVCKERCKLMETLLKLRFDKCRKSLQL